MICEPNCAAGSSVLENLLAARSGVFVARGKIE